jgi:pSer/pThr/pTyr-binding forkhead associated (FHA) protein
MSITVLVRSPDLAEVRLTFDGTRPIVVGRGASCDVRLPDASVSSRHATIRAQGSDLVAVDEGSANGTFVGGARVAPRSARIVRSGDLIRVGRMWIELRVDQGPVTRDVVGATREVALALVSQALADSGGNCTTRLQVVEGRDQGMTLALDEEHRVYVVGRAADCALPLADSDASREHARVVRRGGAVMVRDAGTKNGTWLGDAPVPTDRDIVWRPSEQLRVGRTILALREPIGEALARIERAPDELLADEPVPPPPAEPSLPEPPNSLPPAMETAAPVALVPVQAAQPLPTPSKRPRWSATDLAVIGGALIALVVSVAGLVWLLRP